MVFGLGKRDFGNKISSLIAGILQEILTVLYSFCLKNTFATAGLMNFKIVGVHKEVLQLVAFVFFTFETTYFGHKQQCNEDLFKNEHMV